MGGTAKVCWNVSKEGRGYLKVSCERRGKLKTIIRWLPEMWQQRLPETYHLKAEVTWYVSYEGRGYLKRIIRGPKLPETYHMRAEVTWKVSYEGGGSECLDGWATPGSGNSVFKLKTKSIMLRNGWISVYLHQKSSFWRTKKIVQMLHFDLVLPQIE